MRVCVGERRPSNLLVREFGAVQAPEAFRPSNSKRWALEVNDGELSLESLVAGDCVSYGVPLEGRWVHASFERSVLLPTWHWLWTPADEVRAEWSARFVVPEGMRVAVPFQAKNDGSCELDATAFSRLSLTFVGDFLDESLVAPGARISVARPHELAGRSVQDWLPAAAEAASHLFGEFPVPRALVVLVPAPRDASDPVPFGLTGSGGGASIMLVVRADASTDELRRDWVAPHEFTHLALPWTRRRDAWFGEGLATYYQEVLRARAGLQTEVQAWAALDDGFRRGAAEPPSEATFAEESGNMFVSRNFQRVYWAGAAFALVADVLLRREDSSLDDALGSLRACCRAGIWDATDVIERMAEPLGEQLVAPFAQHLLASNEFPDLRDVYDYLGMRRSAGEGVLLDDEVAGAAVRRAIMAPRTLQTTR